MENGEKGKMINYDYIWLIYEYFWFVSFWFSWFFAFVSVVWRLFLVTEGFVRELCCNLYVERVK